VLRLIALVVPLGLDTFAVAAALGLAGLPQRERLRASLVFAGFETAMPLVGLAGGGLLGEAIGGTAEYVAIAVLVGVGALFLLGDDDAARAERLARARGWAMLSLGVAISLDELASGLTLGLLALPVVLAVVLIGLQALVLSQLGLRLGARVGAKAREWAERLAGIALVGIGAALLVERLVG
jgi:putative Mn2+ efflux pump MntP